jgi:hypothetical protein
MEYAGITSTTSGNSKNGRSRTFTLVSARHEYSGSMRQKRLIGGLTTVNQEDWFDLTRVFAALDRRLSIELAKITDQPDMRAESDTPSG